jgi:hypothetical protein
MKRMWMVGALALLVAALAAAPTSAAAGNSANANLCKNGGWQTVVKADATLFKNQGDCVSYAVRGGTPTPKTTAQLICESEGGTYKIIGPAPTDVLCADIPPPAGCVPNPNVPACDAAITVAIVETAQACASLGVPVAFFEIGDGANPSDRGSWACGNVFP